MEKINWKAWISVVASTFIGGVMAHISVPHEGVGAKQIVVGAILAGGTALLHLFQQPKLAVQQVEEPKVEEPKVEEPKVEEAEA